MAFENATVSVINSLVSAAGGVTKFAEEIGYSRAAVHMWLKGKSAPSEEARAAIAEHYKLPSDDFGDSRVYYAIVDLLTRDEIKPDTWENSPEGYFLLNEEGKKKVQEYINDLLASKRYQTPL